MALELVEKFIELSNPTVRSVPDKSGIINPRAGHAMKRAEIGDLIIETLLDKPNWVSSKLNTKLPYPQYCATDDWRHITQSDDIGPVDIVTPNNAHAEIAIDAARHRKHVYCEKPLANNAASARQMYEAARSAGCVHAVSFVYRLWPLPWRLRSSSSMRAELGGCFSFKPGFCTSSPWSRELR